VSNKAHATEILEHMQSALTRIEDLQRSYDKLLEDTILIAAELGVKASYTDVMDRIRVLRRIETETLAREKMWNTIGAMCETPADPIEIQVAKLDD
jgi:hypothetical protein